MMVDPLHWTLDYQYQSKERDFRGEFLQTLSAALATPAVPKDSKRKVHRYTLLPNFWAGYKQNEPDPLLEMGDLCIERSQENRGLWNYRIHHRNTSSGEELDLAFTCANDPHRTLESPWHIETRNTADGSYESIDWQGRDGLEKEMRAFTLETVQGFKIAVGQVHRDTPVTCNWALIDILPALEDKEATDIALLDDLEMLREHCQIKLFEDWKLQINGGALTLHGFTVFGRGFPPVYWWLSETGEVVAIVSMLATYVLKSREG